MLPAIAADKKINSQLLKAITKVNVYLVSIAILIYSLVQVILSFRWKRILRIGKINLSLLQSFRLYCISIYTNNFFPGSFGGAFVNPPILPATAQPSVCLISDFVCPL